MSKQVKMRRFETGATRGDDQGRLDYDGFLSPLVLERYAQYLNKHRIQADGNVRDSDNWKKGIPLPVYMKSAWRHFMDWWKEHQGLSSREGIEDAMMGLLFNIMGYAHEYIKLKNTYIVPEKCAENKEKYKCNLVNNWEEIVDFLEEFREK